MNWMNCLKLAICATAGFNGPAMAQTATGSDSLLVVYGQNAPSAEGDVDHREQILFSVPADLNSRLYIRIYDPETNGRDDFTYGGPRDAQTEYRVMGGDGAFTKATRPVLVADRDRVRPQKLQTPGPGTILVQSAYGSDPATNERWVTLGAVRARQGEIIGDKAYFRLDVDGVGGNDGNGFSVAVSTVRDRNRPADGLEMFAFQPTISWREGTTATRVTLDPGAKGPFTIQNFDGAKADMTLVSDYVDQPLKASGQDYWSVDSAPATLGPLALSLEGGFETPNDVTVAVFDANGAAVALQMPPKSALDPARPTALGTEQPLADCKSVAFDANTSTGRAPLSYLWDFGDGSSAAQSVIAHRYGAPGQYTATLRIKEQSNQPGAGAVLEVPVHVRSAPRAKGSAPLVLAPNDVVIFDATASEASDSPIVRYIWTFGDGTTANGPIVEKSFEAPGLYQGNLRVEDDSAHPCDFGVEPRLISVNFSPVAVAGTDQTGQTGQMLVFDASASHDVDGTVESYRWDMGDGSILDGARVTHAYTTAGVFTPVLTVLDDSGVSNNAHQDQLSVAVNAPPVPLFAIPDRPVSVSEAATLSAAASTDLDGEILSYMWDFGDGAIGDGQEVNYAWTAPGTYTVALTVTDNSGTGSASQRIERQIVIDAAPVADAGPVQFVTASEVQFDATRSTDAEGVISSYEWDFGDGNVGTGPKPIHAYARPGVYEAVLVVRDDSGAPLNLDRAVTKITVNASPIADAGPPQVVAPGEEIIVSGRASLDPDGQITEFLWTLPDGTTQNRNRIATTLDTPGRYRFGLTVSDDFAGGAAADTTETLITVNQAPIAEAGAGILVAPGDPVRLDATLSYDNDGEIISHVWSFDNGSDPIAEPIAEPAFDVAGVWSAQLVVTDNSGVANATASDDVTIRVNHAPVAQAGPRQNTDSLQIMLDARGSSDADGDALIYTWDLGDGSAPRQGALVDHVYAKSGIYPITLRVDDGTGVSNAKATDSTIVTIRTRPVAVAGANRESCSGQSILFDASDSVDPDGGPLRYSWNFGDGETSELVNPSKTYEQPGAYPVTLEVSNGTGTVWGTAIDRIAALVREGPIADAGPDMTVCTNQSVRFDGSGSTDADGAVNSFRWNFGDGGIASGERPEYRFKKPGNYAVNLTITGESLGSCSPVDVDTVNVEVVAAPEQTILGVGAAAAGLPAQFEVALSDLRDSTVISHAWAFSDGGAGAGADVSHVFETPGAYTVTVTTELAGGHAGCSTIVTQRKIIVNQGPTPQIEGPQVAATGEALIFDASGSVDNDGVITNYAWDFGDGTKAAGLRPAHKFAQAGEYDVVLTITDDAQVGNSSTKVSHKITINPMPVANLEAPQWVCPGSDLPWSVDVPDSTKVTWLFGDTGVRAEGPRANHRFDTPGLYPVSVALDDGLGLANSQRREDRYVRVNAAPTALAGPDHLICPGDVATFDAGASNDMEGAIINYTWRFSDGVTLTGQKVERRFDNAGALTVELHVADASGLVCGIATDTAAVLVNHTPIVDAGPDVQIKVGAAHDVLQFDGSGATDPDGHGLALVWDYGDGMQSTGAITRHKYSKPGIYTVAVQATDGTGLVCGEARDTAQITAIERQ